MSDAYESNSVRDVCDVKRLSNRRSISAPKGLDLAKIGRGGSVTSAMSKIFDLPWRINFALGAIMFTCGQGD